MTSTPSDEQLDAAVSAINDPERLRDAQDLVARAAPALQRVLATAIAEGGWFDLAHAVPEDAAGRLTPTRPPGGDCERPAGLHHPPHLLHERGHIAHEEDAEHAHDRVERSAPMPGACCIPEAELQVGDATQAFDVSMSQSPSAIKSSLECFQHCESDGGVRFGKLTVYAPLADL